jgi:hypothetical protein
MQRRNLGKAMRYLVAVCALGSAFALFACSSDDDKRKKNVNYLAVITARLPPCRAGNSHRRARFQWVSGQVTLIFALPKQFSLSHAQPVWAV